MPPQRHLVDRQSSQPVLEERRACTHFVYRCNLHQDPANIHFASVVEGRYSTGGSIGAFVPVAWGKVVALVAQDMLDVLAA